MSLDGVEKSVRMLQRRGCLAVRSRSWRRQPEKLGCQQKTVCTMVQPDSWWQNKSGEDVGRPYQRYGWAVPDTGVQRHTELCSVSTAILTSIRSGTRSQCRHISVSLMWSARRRWKMSRAAIGTTMEKKLRGTMFVCIAHASCHTHPSPILCPCRLQPVRTFFDQKHKIGLTL